MRSYIVAYKGVPLEEHDKDDDLPFIVLAEDKRKAKKIVKDNILKILLKKRKFIKNGIIGDGEFILVQQGCDACEWADPTFNTCVHECVQKEEWWYNIYLNYFKDKRLADMLRECVNDNVKNIDEVIDFVIKKEGIEFFEFNDLSSMCKFHIGSFND